MKHRLAVLTTIALACSGNVCSRESVLRVAMAIGDIPLTSGIPNQGNEGFRFVGYNLYDALVLWDLSRSDIPSDIRPGLATGWHVDPGDHKRWVFRLRQGVKWHDGCDFSADDVLWNYARVTDRLSPQFSLQQFTFAAALLATVAGVEKIDQYTIAVNTTVVDSFLPYTLAQFLLVSPCRARQLDYDWRAYSLRPSGTGPYRFDRMVPHERLELVPNAAYWDPRRIPKHDRLVLLPMPEPMLRAAALVAGQVDFIEEPLPDDVPRLREAGMQIVSNIYPHVWWYYLNHSYGPFRDIRVRKAANHAINRSDVRVLVNDLAVEAYATVPPSMPYYGNPVIYEFDPARARALLAEAQCLPCRITLITAPAGSGFILPVPINELIAHQLEEAGFEVTLRLMDWAALANVSFAGGQGSPGIDAYNAPHGLMDPANAIVKVIATRYRAPRGLNWGYVSDPDMDRLSDAIYREFDPARRNDLLTQLHEKISASAANLFVVHGKNHRALSPRLKGFVQAQSWFQDLTPIVVTP